MPPKPKFTREDYINCAYEIARTDGMDAVVAREVGRRLGTSSTPVFSVFGSMEGLKREVRAKAMEEFCALAYRALEYSPAFKQFGLFMINFAKDEPELFRLLFMDGGKCGRDFSSMIPELGECAEVILGTIERDYSLSRSQAETMFSHMWIFTYGICVFCVNGIYDFTDDKLADILGRQFIAMMMLLRSGGDGLKTPHPEKGMGNTSGLDEVIGAFVVPGKENDK